MTTAFLTETSTEEQVQLATFALGPDWYGIDVHHVQEVNRMSEITRVPNVPAFVEGVINQRGRIIPVLNLRKRLGMGEKPYDQQTRILSLDILDNAVALIVDSVGDVLTLPKQTIESASKQVDCQHPYAKRMLNIDARALILLDLAKVIDFKASLIIDDYDE